MPICHLNQQGLATYSPPSLVTETNATVQPPVPPLPAISFRSIGELRPPTAHALQCKWNQASQPHVNTMGVNEVELATHSGPVTGAVCDRYGGGDGPAKHQASGVSSVLSQQPHGKGLPSLLRTQSPLRISRPRDNCRTRAQASRTDRSIRRLDVPFQKLQRRSLTREIAATTREHTTSKCAPHSSLPRQPSHPPAA